MLAGVVAVRAYNKEIIDFSYSIFSFGVVVAAPAPAPHKCVAHFYGFFFTALDNSTE